MSDNNLSDQQQEFTSTKNEALEYSISKARVTGDLVVIKVIKTNRKVVKYDETNGKDSASVIYGQVVAINPKNKFNIKCGAHVIYDGTIKYVIIENNDEYIVGNVSDIIIVWERTA